MNGLTVLMTMAVLGVDYGWQPTPTGQLEYIIQIEPALLESMKRGERIVSEIHPDARGVRRFVIQVGTGEVPRKGLLSAETTPTHLAAPRAAAATLGDAGQAEGPQDAPAPAALGTGPTSGTGPILGAGRDRPIEAPFGAAANSAAAASLPGSDIVTRLLGNLPPPPNHRLSDTDTPLPGQALGSTGSGPAGTNAVHGPTLAQPNFDPRPSPPQVSDNAGQASGSFQLPPWARATEAVPPSHDAPSPALSPGGGWPLPTGNQPGNDATQPLSTPRPIQPPTLIDRSQPPINDPDAAKAEVHQGDGIQEESSPSDRLGRLASNVKLPTDAAAQKPTLDEKTARELAESETPKPWMPLLLTSFALFASLAANMYLGWIAIGIYRRYRNVVGQLHQARAATA